MNKCLLIQVFKGQEDKKDHNQDGKPDQSQLRRIPFDLHLNFSTVSENETHIFTLS